MVTFFLVVYFTLFSNSLTAQHLLLVDTDDEIKNDSGLTLPAGGSGSDYRNRIDPLEFRNIKVENACERKEEGFPCTT